MGELIYLNPVPLTAIVQKKNVFLRSHLTSIETIYSILRLSLKEQVWIFFFQIPIPLVSLEPITVTSG